MTITSIANIGRAEVFSRPAERFDGDGNAAPGAGQAQEIQTGAAELGRSTGKPETELRAAAKRHGLTMKELAARMGVSAGYLSMVSTGAHALDSGDAGKGRVGVGRGP